MALIWRKHLRLRHSYQSAKADNAPNARRQGSPPPRLSEIRPIDHGEAPSGYPACSSSLDSLSWTVTFLCWSLSAFLSPTGVNLEKKSENLTHSRTFGIYMLLHAVCAFLSTVVIWRSWVKCAPAVGLTAATPALNSNQWHLKSNYNLLQLRPYWLS